MAEYFPIDVSMFGSYSGSFSGSFFGNGSKLTNVTASYVNPLYQQVLISGSLKFDPTQDPDPTGLDLDSTVFFQSSSNTSLGYDLYVRQNGNLVKWKWIEGVLNTGLLFGGIVTYSGSNIFVSSGSGIIVEHNATSSLEISPIITYVTWPEITQSISNISTQQVTYLYIDENGDLQQQSSRFTPQQYHNYIPLGAVGHFDYTQASAFGGQVQTSYDQISQISTFVDAFGPLKLSGYGINGQPGSLKFSIGSGTSFIHGGFYENDPEFPSQITTPSQITASLAYIYRSGSGVRFDTNNGTLYTNLRPGFYDPGTGVTASVSNNNWTIQRVFSDPKTGVAYIYYGQKIYPDFNTALAGLSSDPFTEGDTFDFTTFLGYLVLKSNTTDLTNTSDNSILAAGLFRGVGGGGSGGGSPSVSLDDLSDVSITSPTNGQALIYDSGSALWINGNVISASYATTASFITTASTNAFVQGGNSFGAQALLGTNDNQSLAFETSGSTRMFISSSGNVGIGTTTPTSTLDVSGSSRISSNITVTGSLTVSGSARINTLTIGLGGGQVSNNTAVGVDALFSNTSGTTNSAFGNSTLRANTTGVENVAVGHNAMRLNVSGAYNTAVGNFALFNSVGSIGHTAVGYAALNQNTTGYYNSVVGFHNLSSNTTGYENSSVGFETLRLNTTGYRNSAFGAYALRANTTGIQNVAIGLNAGRFIADGSANNTITNNSIYIGVNTRALADNQTNQIVIGDNITGLGSNTVTLGNDSITRTALKGNVSVGTTGSIASRLHVKGSGATSATTALRVENSSASPSLVVLDNGFVGINTGSAQFNLDVNGTARVVSDASISGFTVGRGGGLIVGNTVVGFEAGLNNTTGNITAFGYQAGKGNTTSSDNTALGYGALRTNSISSFNTAVGTFALRDNTAANNVAIGAPALLSNTSGTQNVGVGNSALRLNLTSNNNTAVGYESLRNNIASNNTAIGHGSGYNGGANANTTGANNIFIGWNAIGVSATESNRTWIGNSSTTSTWLAGNTLIGTTTDAGFKLDVSGSARITNGLTVTGSFIAPTITGSLLGTASYATQALSASFAPSTPAFPFTGSAIVSGSLTITGSLQVGVPGANNPTIDTTVGILGRGASTTTDWINRVLYNSSDVISVDWESGFLNNSAGTNTVDWNSNYLYDTATNLSIDWENRDLRDSAGVRALNYNSRVLVYPDTAPALNYGIQDQISMNGSVSVTGSLLVTGSVISNTDGLNRLARYGTALSGSTIGTGVTAQTIVYSQLIPANTFSAGNIFRTYYRFRKLSTNANATHNILVNTTAAVAGATTLATLTANTVHNQIKRDFYIAQGNATTTVGSAINIATDDTTNTQLLSVINWGIDQYIIYTVTLNTADSGRGLGYTIEQVL